LRVLERQKGEERADTFQIVKNELRPLKTTYLQWMAVGLNNAYMDAHVPRKYRLLCKLCERDSDSDDSIDPAVSGKVMRGKKPNIDYASEDLGDTDGHSNIPANHLQDLFGSDEDETEAL